MSHGPAMLLSELYPLLVSALGVLLRSALGAAALVAATLGVSVMMAGGGWRSLAAAGICLLVGLAAGGFVAVNRAVFSLVERALGKLGLGRRVLTLLFEDLLGIAGSSGDPRSGVAGVVERLPLRDGEQRLKATADRLLARPRDGERGGLRRWLAARAHERVVRLATRVTLAELRRADGGPSGIDLALVRDRLLGTIDVLLVRLVRETSFRVTVQVAGAAVLLCVGGAWVLREL